MGKVNFKILQIWFTKRYMLLTSVHSSILRPLQDRLDLRGFEFGVGVVVDDRVVEAQRLVVRLHPRKHGGRGRGRIGSLSVDAVSL